MTEQEQREEAIDSISMSVMDSYEMACEWPKYDSFVDICDEHDLEPSKVLYGHCINLAKIKWQALTMGVKAEIAKDVD